MFYLLCVALCLGVLFLALTTALVGCFPFSNLIRRSATRATAASAADMMFGFRIAPFALATIVSLGLAVPAFLEFEPRSTREMLDWPLLSLAVGGASVLLVILLRMAMMLRATWNLQHHWIENSVSLDLDGVRCPVYCVDRATSLLAVTGIFRPRIFISADIAQALTRHELAAALGHELAHLRSFDNLKQLLLRSIALPFAGFRDMDRAWVSASEIAADEDAVRSGASALELSSALVKVARLSTGMTVNLGLAASHLVPYGCGASTSTRAAHLSKLLAHDATPSEPIRGLALLTAGLLLLALYCVSLSALLPAVHDALEWMVR